MYGLILCVLALLVFVLELPRLPDNVTLSWAAMSQYQKDFYNNDKALLQAARQLNSLLVGIFTVVIGVLFIILGALSFKLHAEIGVRMVFDKKQSSRLPVMDNVLQQVRFKGYTELTIHDDSDKHYTYLRSYIEMV